MKYYTDINDFCRGVRKLAQTYKHLKQMPVMLSVDGKIAPFGICTEETVNGVPCLVLRGGSESVANVTTETRKCQIRDCKSLR